MAKKRPITPPTPEELEEQVRQLNDVLPEGILNMHVQTTDDPRPDAPRYEVETILDMFAMVNEENLDRFLKDLRIMFEANNTVRKLLTAIANGFGDPNAATPNAVNIHRFTWIDDNQ